MASIGTVKFELSKEASEMTEFFTNTRIAKCGAFECVNNVSGNCGYKSVIILTGGQCASYYPSTEGEDD